MDIVRHGFSESRPCPYRPGQTQVLEKLIVRSMEASDYERLLEAGWRKFGRCVFRPRCPTCRACESLRVDVAGFRPNRAQRRVRARNEGEVALEIGEPRVSAENLAMYDAFHEARSEARDWGPREPATALDYSFGFAENPAPTVREYRHRLPDGSLMGLGYVDELPTALSAIYFMWDPARADRSPGTWNILTLIDRARELGAPRVHLGYFVADCPSLSYKRNFRPHERLAPDGRWIAGD